MSTKINIQSQSTMTFRTDCFGTGFDIDYFIRQDYYMPKITDAIGQNRKYDVGYNPLGTKWPKPSSFISEFYTPSVSFYSALVCDRLFFVTFIGDDRYPEVHSISDLPYSELKFQKPLIAIPHSAFDPMSNQNNIILQSDYYYQINRLYLSSDSIPSLHGEYSSKIEGIKHKNGQAIPYNEIFESLNTRYYLKTGNDLRIESLRQTPQICTQDQLEYVFRNTNSSYSIWNVISECTHGGLYYCGFHSGYFDVIPMFWYYYPSDEETYHVAQFYWGGYNLFTDTGQRDGIIAFILPFVSEDEYNAAVAVNIEWNDEIMEQIDQYIN